MYSTSRQLTILLLSSLLIGPGFADSDSRQDDVDPLFSWEGFRIARYRSPTPDQAEGGQRINTAALQSLQQQSPRPALIDVQPVRWQQGVFLTSQPRFNLPGSLWLPNVGLGELDSDWTEYFHRGLEQVANGSKSYPLVFYCTADCWMSWNAVKRASEWGYNRIYWYAEGTDGWQEADLALEKAEPLPFSLQP
ncbi:rhodanese-like domain-containing protein [Marinobacterium marinum]|nr:rhodanese-like domain-containing protein [Marinobacterium marinum]